MASRLRQGMLGAITAVAVALSPLAFTGTAAAYTSGPGGHDKPGTPGGPGPKDPVEKEVAKLVKDVSGKNVKKHLKAFQAIADAHNGTRVSGTSGFDASRDYVAGKLRKAGYQVTIQPFEFVFDGYITPPVLQRTSGTPKTYTYGFFSDYVAMGDSPAGSVSGTVQAVDLTLPPGPEPFIEAGIPAGGLFTGAEERKTEEEAAIFGGTAGLPLDPCYHGACDTIENINDFALDVNADAIATLTGTYAFDIGDMGATRPAPASAARSAEKHTHKPADAAS